MENSADKLVVESLDIILNQANGEYVEKAKFKNAKLILRKYLQNCRLRIEDKKRELAAKKLLKRMIK
jgi:hypothetical protein